MLQKVLKRIKVHIIKPPGFLFVCLFILITDPLVKLSHQFTVKFITTRKKPAKFQ